MKDTQTSSNPAPWWLGGEERCPHCLQLYAYEVEIRCVACDGPMCPHCTVRTRESAAMFCLGCDCEEGS